MANFVGRIEDVPDGYILDPSAIQDSDTPIPVYSEDRKVIGKATIRDGLGHIIIHDFPVLVTEGVTGISIDPVPQEKELTDGHE